MELEPTSNPAVEQLFSGHTTLRAVIEAALEGIVGKVRIDDPENPRAGILEVGCYSVFGGDPDQPCATEWLNSLELPREVILPNQSGWRDLLHSVHGPAAVDSPMRTFSPHLMDPSRLKTLATRDLGSFRIAPFGPGDAEGLTDDLIPHALESFTTTAEFERSGVGYKVYSPDEGMVAACTSYAVSRTRLEIAIATHPAYRRRGFAASVSSAMVLHCLRVGLRPEWSAANPASKALALSLGFRPGELCDSVAVSSQEQNP